MDTTNMYDLVIIGGGPTGLTAATYAAREGMKVVVLERGVLGGMAAITDRIDNYPGFPNGVSGLELTDLLEAQAKRFEAEIKTGVEVTDITQAQRTLKLSTKSAEYTAKSVLIATGSTYKHLEVPGEAEFTGKGVHYCATCDGPVYKGKRLVVVGGGNSAVQETLFLARFASHITMLVRGEALKASQVLIDELNTLTNVEVIYETSVTGINGADGFVRSVSAQDKTGRAQQFETDGVFVFVGLLANTEAFTAHIEHDERNFTKTNERFMTSMPGVFAAGDVRSGATWQIASAVGEGASATLAIREYLLQLKRQPITQ